MSEKFKTGSLIAGTYRVLDFIGEGAMGLVYKVEHTLLNKTLAFKVLKTEQLSDSVWKRFHIEAQAIARLDHPNIVKIYDMSQTEDGLPFFTMDLLVGLSLDDYLQDYGRLSVEEALPIFRQICAGLAYANDHGIIHRDIKPGNIMLVDFKEDAVGQCTVKIVDFGIAKLVDDGNTSQQGLTRPGEVFGSPLYMSPEQCMGTKLDQRTDMYSVGITMFQALTGRPPLLGKSAVETAAMHQSQEPPMLCDIAPDVDFPIELEEVIATMLAKSPDDRYSSLAEVASELLQIERGEIISSPREMAGLTHRLSSEQRYTDNSSGNYSDSYRDTSNRLNDTQERTETRSQHLSPKQAWLVAALTTVTLVISVSIILDLKIPTNKTDKKLSSSQPTIQQNPEVFSLRTQSVELPAIEDSVADKAQHTFLNDEERKVVQAYLDSHKGSYSRIEKRNGKNFKVFDFPTTFTLGNFWCTNEKITIERDANGQLIIPVGTKIKFDSEKHVETCPELLTRFQPDDVGWFCIANVRPRNSDLAKSVAHLRSLNKLELKNCDMNNSDLKTLEALKKLTVLNISGTSFTGAELAHSPLIKQLAILQVEYLSEPTPLLETLQRNNKLTTFDLRHTKLQKKDFATISQMSKLSSLTAKDSGMTDADLETLTKLPKLIFLNIDTCNDLTVDCVGTFGKFRQLKVLSLPDQLSTDSIKAKIKKQLPNIIFDPHQGQAWREILHSGSGKEEN